jgi:hypothetical protein
VGSDVVYQSERQVSEGHPLFCADHALHGKLCRIDKLVVINDNGRSPECGQSLRSFKTENANVAKGSKPTAISFSPESGSGVFDSHTPTIPCELADCFDIGRNAKEMCRK